MAVSCEEIHEEYRTAGFSKRLDIYLQFPELRNAFHEIEQKDGKTDFLKTADHRRQGCKGWKRIISRSRILFKFRGFGKFSEI